MNRLVDMIKLDSPIGALAAGDITDGRRIAISGRAKLSIPAKGGVLQTCRDDFSRCGNEVIGRQSH